MSKQVKYCPACGVSFECKRDDIENCQCSTAHLTPAVLDTISGLYTDCLCENCLAEISKEAES